MKLSKTEVAWLRNSLSSKERQPDFWTVFWSAKKAWVLAVPVGLLGVAELSKGLDIIGYALIALAWGQVYASAILSVRAVNLWPAFHEITNWERVEALLRENE